VGRQFAARGHGIYKSTDAAQTWVRIGGDPMASVYASAFAIDPTDDRVVYVATEGSGIYKTVDGGDHWSGINQGLTALYMEAVAIDPTDPETLYTESDIRYTGGIFVSHDGGATWGSTGLDHEVDISMAMAPSDPRTLYVGTEGHGVFVSRNGGLTWTPASQGLPKKDRQVLALAVDPHDPMTAYAGLSVSGVYRTTDGGATWAPLNTGLWERYVLGLALTPDGDRIYAATGGGGVFQYTFG
jgi:photosystem II stability/assembly factor-like uncharacterized protein